MPSRPTSYHSVLRENLRRLRTERGLRQEDVAARARQLGLRWDAATVMGLELGRRQVSAGELLLLPTLLGAPLSEFLVADGGADFDGAPVTKEGLKWLARGEPLDAPARMLAVFARVEAGATDAEKKAVRSLGKDGLDLPLLDLIALSKRLWGGRRLDQERDRRLQATPGEGDPARRRGAITRRLLEELRNELAPPRTAWEEYSQPPGEQT